MAIYINLGVDCGFDESIANLVVSHFQDFQIELPDLSPVELRISKTFARRRWYVGVCPLGLSYAAPSGDRPKLREEAVERLIETAITDHLSKISGYRRAQFGGECFDKLARGDDEEDDDIEYPGMIFSVAEFGAHPPSLIVEAFATGLKRVTELDER